MDPDAVEGFDDLLVVGSLLPSFIDDGRWDPQDRLQQLVFATLGRGRNTYETILELLRADNTLPAAMLSRSLFEDMVVAHWLVLHHEDPDWLLDRFERHRDAIHLSDASNRVQFGLPTTEDDEAPSMRTRQALIEEFGRYAERDWWGQTSSGARLNMPELVAKLAAAPIFQPRLRGEAPVLEQYYAVQQKAWTRALHHTAAGMRLTANRARGFPDVVAETPRFLILFGNYWVFGQLLFVALELGTSAEVVAAFEARFLTGLAGLGQAVGVEDEPPWMDRVNEWLDENDPS